MRKELGPAADAFNRGQYLAASEQFEQIAAAGDNELKAVAGALTRVAAACHLRFERGGRQGAINLLSQAMLIMDDLKPERAGIDIERMFDEIAAFTEEIRATPKHEHGGLKHRARLFIERRRVPAIKTR